MEHNQLIPAELAGWINELLSGARIEKISSDTELAASVELLKKTKQTLADLKKDKDAKVTPLFAEYKAALAVYTEKIEALESMAKNIGNKGAEYQLELQRAAEAERRRREAEAEAERKRLADIENKRLEEEEALRKAAIESQKAGDTEQANLNSELADIALTEATDAAEAAQTVQSAPVQEAYKPAGFKAKIEYSARLNDCRSFLKWIVDNNEFGYIEGANLTKACESAANKLAKVQQDKFKVPGCSLVETAASRVRY